MLVFLGYFAIAVFGFIHEYSWEHVCRCFPLWVAHGERGGIDAFSDELVLQAVAVAVASDDAAYLPEAEVVEKFTTGDAYFAHEQLVDVVGGCQFFPLSSVPDGDASVVVASLGSPLGTL